MSILSFLSFGLGGIHSLRREVKDPVLSGEFHMFMIVASLASTGKNIVGDIIKIPINQKINIYTLPERILINFCSRYVFYGTAYCLGHLTTKMAYPVIKKRADLF